MSSEPLRLSSPVRSATLLERDGDSVETLLRRERERGRAAGIAEGRALAQAEAGALLEEIGTATETERAHALDALARSAVALGTTIARTLLKVEIPSGRYDIEAMVRETLANGPRDRGACSVHLNPADCARLEGVPFRAGTTITPDEDVARGDVHVETSVGLLVRETNDALAEIERRLLEDVA